MTGGKEYDPAAPSASASTTDVAKDQASQVAGGAADAAQHVTGMAKERVGQVAAAAGQQVKELAGKVQSELTDQAKAQQEKLAGGLHSVGEQLKSMAQKSEQPGVATDLAHQGAEKAHQIAGWLQDRTPADVLTELRSFARRRPVSFLAAALAADVVAGRLARGLSADPAAPAGGGNPPVPATPVAPAVVGGPAPLALPGGRDVPSVDP